MLGKFELFSATGNRYVLTLGDPLKVGGGEPDILSRGTASACSAQDLAKCPAEEQEQVDPAFWENRKVEPGGGILLD